MNRQSADELQERYGKLLEQWEARRQGQTPCNPDRRGVHRARTGMADQASTWLNRLFNLAALLITIEAF